jgi:hypothetical protein
MIASDAFKGELLADLLYFAAEAEGFTHVSTPKRSTGSIEDDHVLRLIRPTICPCGFFTYEAQGHTLAGRPYLAQPIMASGRMVGVLYLFSTETPVFPRAVDSSRLQGTAEIIAAFLEGAVRLSELPVS